MKYVIVLTIAAIISGIQAQRTPYDDARHEAQLVTLKYALEQANIADVKALFDAGVSPYADIWGQSVFEIAFALPEESRERMVRFLLDYGVNPNRIRIDDRSVLWPVVEHNMLPIAALLLEAGAMPNVTYHGIPLLIRAIRNQYVDMAELLLSFYADPNDGGYYRILPLLEAMAVKNVPIMELLLSYGADWRFLTAYHRQLLNRYLSKDLR